MSEGQPASPVFPDERGRELNTFCAPLIFGSFQDHAFKAAKAIQGQATITFGQLDGRHFGITNEHVLSEKPDPLGDRVWHLALKRHTAFPLVPLATTTFRNDDAPYDLAIFDLPPDLVVTILKSGKRFAEIPPNRVLHKGDRGAAVGFPAAERKILSTHTAHPMYIAVATCQTPGDRKIIMHDHLRGENRCFRFGGMSGGPIFRITEASNEVAGVIFQGVGPNDPQTGPDGETLSDSREEVWAWGFPLTRPVIEATLRYGKPRP
jgi:hypothetical protein